MFLSLWAQEINDGPKDGLENKRIQLQEQIAQTEKELAALKEESANSIESLELLQDKLSAREQLVDNLDQQIMSLENGIDNANSKMEKLGSSLKSQRRVYAELVRFSYKNRTSQNFILFLFSSKNFNQITRRLRYVKEYRSFRAKQSEAIQLTSLKLKKTAGLLESRKNQKGSALQSQMSQNLALEQETKLQKNMVSGLKLKEGDLKKRLLSKRKTAARLNNAIANAIKTEINLAQKRAITERADRIKELAEKKARERKAAAAQELKNQKAAIANAKKAKKIEQERLNQIAKERKAAQLKAKKLAIEQKKQKEKEATLLAEREAREAKERALEKKRAEQLAFEKKLAEEKAQREEDERIAKELEVKRAREKKQQELKRLKKAQEERERKLAREREKQELERKRLAEVQRKQKEREEKLALEKKRQEELQRKLEIQRQKRIEEERRIANERKANAKRTGQFLNPRYNPELASADKEKAAKEVASRKPKIVQGSSTAKEKKEYSSILRLSQQELSAKFEARRGTHPWPVSNGYISERFGKNKHPVFNIYTENYGIDIKANKGTQARAVFPGEVTSVFSIPGAGVTVIVNHGSYFTVYSKLKSVRVVKGTKVMGKQNIGSVMTDDNGQTSIHFEVWKVTGTGTPTKMNPEYWVKKL